MEYQKENVKRPVPRGLINGESDVELKIKIKT